MVQWTLNCQVPSSNLLAIAVVPLGEALNFPHCLIPQIGLKAIGPQGDLPKTSLLSLFIVARCNNPTIQNMFNVL